MKAISVNKKYKPRTILDQVVTFTCDNGICSLESSVDVMGVQLEFKGKAEITPKLPKGWVLQGNNNRIIMFTLEGNPIQNHTLFSYIGYVEIIGAIFSNHKGERLSQRLISYPAKWESSNWSMDVEADSWENFKDTKRKGKVNKTKYNLPDYNLPEVGSIKKTKKRVQRKSRTGGY